VLLDDFVVVVSSSFEVKYAVNGSTDNPTRARAFLPSTLDETS
jgi:hypothetical protein